MPDDTTTLTAALSVGSRVTATVWGRKKTGTVDRYDSSIVWVLWDDGRYQWMNPESLTRL